MFGNKKKAKSPSSSTGGAKSRNNDLANMMGLGMPRDDDDDDESLLAELATLQGRPVQAQKKKPQKALVSMAEIDKMVAEGMKDINDSDDDSDVDENDLLAELNDLTGGDDEDEDLSVDEPQSKNQGSEMSQLLQERKNMYLNALQNAKKEGASSKIRRFDRAVKELDSLLKKSEKGITIKEEEIPPPVAVKTSKPIDPTTQTLPGPTAPAAIPQVPMRPITSPPKEAPKEPQPSPSQTTNSQLNDSTNTASSSNAASSEKLNSLLERQKQFKVAALKMKQNGNIDEARKYLGISKQFDTVIDALKLGKEVDLSDMPEPPSLQPIQASAPPQGAPPQVQPKTTEIPAGSSSAGITQSDSGPPPAPTTVLGALEQRLAKYEDASNKAKEEGNSGKVRRMGRIVKQYQDAIKACKLKKQFDYSELPTPPGFGPIPGFNEPADAPRAPISQPAPSTAAVSQNVTANQPQATRNEKEYDFLMNRQKEFKLAALEAKKKDDIESAREYLKQAKGLDQMILAAQNGMRVDVSTVPSVKRKSASITSSDSASGGSSGALKQPVEFRGSINDQYNLIETALRKQIETSESNTQHYKLLGNLDAAKNFEALLKSSKNDLNSLLQYKKQGSPIPKCNYITKSFPVIKSNPQLSDSELEITVVRCINVPLPSGYQPKDMWIYVTYELPYPTEKPQSGHTSTKKETINPEFSESFKTMIDRKNRTFSRFCKRQSVNVKVYHVRGFLKSDKAIGQANIKMERFTNRCEIHESVDLVDLDKGRKSVGGKIEIMLKIREPLVDQDAEIIKEKWLVLDTHLRGLDMKTSHRAQPQATATAPSLATANSSYESLEVLKHEKDLLERQVAAYKSQGKHPPAAAIEKIKSDQEKMQSITVKMRQGGTKGVKDYLSNLVKGLDIEKMKAQNALRKNDKDTAKQCLSRKKLIEKEIGILKQRLGL